ncbi:MAG: leucine zipper domain-containing protein [Thermofilum sp.]
MLRIPRAQAPCMIGLGRRQMQRIVKHFLEEGIQGLRLRSSRPHTMPNRTPEYIERMVVVEVRKATGFGSEQIAKIVNEGLAGDGTAGYSITDTTCYNILTRNGLVESERRMTDRGRNTDLSNGTIPMSWYRRT